MQMRHRCMPQASFGPHIYGTAPARVLNVRQARLLLFLIRVFEVNTYLEIL